MKILNLKKKINFSFLFLVFFFFLIVSFSLATEGILLEDFGGRLSNVEGMIQNDPSAALAAYINFLVNMAFGLLSIAAVILIIWGGIDLITGKQKYTEILTAKNKIIKGILAIIILALSFVVFERINPNILIINFSPIVEKGEIELEHGDWDKDFGGGRDDSNTREVIENIREHEEEVQEEAYDAINEIIEIANKKGYTHIHSRIVAGVMEGTLDGNRKRARESCEEFIFDNPKFNFMKMHCTLLTADKREEFIQRTSGNRPFLIQQLMGKEGSNQFIVFYKILETFEVEFGKAPGSFDQCQKFVDEVLRPALLNSENVKYVYTHEDEVCREFRNKTIFLRYRALEEVNRENYPPL